MYLKAFIIDINGSQNFQLGVAQCKEIRIRKSRKILLAETGILDFGIRNTAQGIQNPTSDWNLESHFHLQKLESSTWNSESTLWNPESRTVLDSLT